jgi:hypothetical protein
MKKYRDSHYKIGVPHLCVKHLCVSGKISLRSPDSDNKKACHVNKIHWNASATAATAIIRTTVELLVSDDDNGTSVLVVPGGFRFWYWYERPFLSTGR